MNADQKQTLALLNPIAVPDSSLIVRRGSLPEQLEADIVSSDSVKLLVAGQRGMGKTTELRRFVSLLDEREFIPVFLQFGSQESISEPGLLAAMAESLYASLENGVAETELKALQSWFEQEDRTTLVEEGSQGEAGLGGDFLVLSGKAKVAHRKSTAKTSKKTVVKTKRELVTSFNDFVERVRAKMKRRVVFVVDDIDKVQDSKSIESTFIHSAHLIGEIACPCVFTVPITYATSTYLRIASLPYNAIYRVPAVELLGPSGQIKAEGFDFMREILSRRMIYNPIPPELLDVLMRYSGGVLVDALRLTYGVCKQVILNSRANLHAAVESEFQRIVDDFKYVFDRPALWKKLSGFCKTVDKRVFVTEELILELLYKMIVIEYRDSEMWFDLHPAARRLYENNAKVIDSIANG